MKPGPPQKPTPLRLLEGNPSRRPLPLNEPKPRPLRRVPAPPEHLDEEGRREWRRLGSHLCKLGLLTDLDLTAFLAYCDTYERWLHYSREAKRAPLITTPNGHIQQSPFVGMANTAFKMMRSILGEFGLTPASRSRISVDPADREDDELSKFLFRT